MQRGEVNGSCGMFESSVRGAFHQYVEAGDFKISCSSGATGSALFRRCDADVHDAEDRRDRKVADVIFRQTELARPLAAPPGTPMDRVNALRKAMLETMKDPGVIADGKKINISWEPVSGEEAAQMFVDFTRTSAGLGEKSVPT